MGRDGPQPGPRSDDRPEEASEASSSRQTTLTINAIPWAEVRLDDRPLGSTPKRQIAIDTGERHLVLSCPPLGRSAKVTLRAEPDQAIRVLADLSQEPPEVTVRPASAGAPRAATP
jgi:hypothetical protein